MTDDDTPPQTTRFAPSRRSAMRTGTLAALGATLGLGSGVGSVAAADSGSGDGEPTPSARIYAGDCYPNARFRVVSEPLDYKPETPVQEGESFIADLYWNDHDTRVLRYANTNERVLFFPPKDVPLDEATVYRTGSIRSIDELPTGVVTVGFGPAEG